MRHYWSRGTEALLLSAIEKCGSVIDAYRDSGQGRDAWWAAVVGAFVALGGPVISPQAARTRYDAIKARERRADVLCARCGKAGRARADQVLPAGWGCADDGDTILCPGCVDEPVVEEPSFEILACARVCPECGVVLTGGGPCLACGAQDDDQSGDVMTVEEAHEALSDPGLQDAWARAEAMVDRSEMDLGDEIADVRMYAHMAAMETRIVRKLVERICDELGVDVSRYICRE